MAVKLYNQNPKVTDQIEFEFLTLKNGCYDDPYTFDSIKIFYISRSQTQTKDLETTETSANYSLQSAYNVAVQNYCDDPTDENAKLRDRALQLLEASTISLPTYYSEATPIYCAGYGCQGSTDYVWRSWAPSDYSVIESNPSSDIPNGRFKFVWEPGSIKEGDYFVCYSYTPNAGGDAVSEYFNFYIQSNIQNEVTLPTHATPPRKYQTLVDSYLPEMYKLNYAKNDKSVTTIDNLNSSVASAYTELENLAARLIDILDANATPEPYLTSLANLFALKLRSTDITRWRGQIKTAVPLYKKKGTLGGLRQALGQAGMTLHKFSQYWQTISPFSYTENFIYDGVSDWQLSKVSLPLNTSNPLSFVVFEVFKRTKTGSYVSQSLNDISITTASGASTLSWIGDQLDLGDSIKITYQIKTFADNTEVLLYQYWLLLPLQDRRDDRLLQPPYVPYPPKNWNVRLISEDDTLFSSFVVVKNPFTPPVVFGKVRTQFPYSENIYNMDEYNGSLRDSTNPKDMDKNFLEPCSSGISAYYGLDVEIQNLNTFRYQECQEIILDYTPFHAMLHTLNFSGSFQEFMVPPEENIEFLVMSYINDFMIAGDAQYVFNRDIFSLVSSGFVKRDDLAVLGSTVDTGTTNAYNDTLIIYCTDPSINFNDVGIDPTPANTILEIFSPSTYAGTYIGAIDGTVKNGIKLVDGTIVENPTPVFSNFTFRVSNILYDGNFATETANVFTISDINNDFIYYQIDDTCTVQINGTGPYYGIKNVNNNKIYLIDDVGTPLSTTDATVQYSVVNSSSVEILNSNTGNYEVCLLGKITMPSPGTTCFKLIPAQNIFFDDGTNEYPLWGYPEGDPNSFLVSGYTGSGTISGKVLNRIIDDKVGNFGYVGFKIDRPGTFPTFTNPATQVTQDENLPANYILTLTVGSASYDYCFVLESGEYSVSSTYLHIAGAFFNVGTSSRTGASLGDTVNYTLQQYETLPSVTIRGDSLRYLDRSGQEVLSSTTETSSFALNMAASSEQQNQGPVDYLKQISNIGFEIQYKDGTTKQGEIDG